MNVRNTVFLLALFIFTPLYAGYYAFEPRWDGYIIWGGEVKTQTALLVDISKAIINGSGTDSTTLCNHILGNASCAGIRTIYWRLDDGRGHLLFDSNQKDSVLALPNLAVDFSKIDYAEKAYELTRKLGMEIYLVADGNYIDEARIKFSPVKVISSKEISAKDLVSESNMIGIYTWDVARLAKANLSGKTLYFRKSITTQKQLMNASICVTSRNKYKLYFDGRLIGEDSEWWIGETYDITELSNAGNHVIGIEVEPDRNGERGLLLNALFKYNDRTDKISTNAEWLCSDTFVEGWNKPDYNDKNWKNAIVVGFDGCVPWMRLIRPWNNKTSVISDDSSKRPIAVSKVSVAENSQIANLLIDSSSNDRSAWYGKVPCEIELSFDKSRPINEIRIYSGNIEYSNNNSGALNIKKYSIDVYQNGQWIRLIEPMQALAYKGEKCADFFIRHKIDNKNFEKMKLVVIESFDTGLRVHCPDKPCAESKLVYIREISFYDNLESSIKK
ncbi:MAG: hypothetical protein ABFD79_15330 [Phycisphaerales bacterium]